MERTFQVPRVLDEVLAETRVPGHWPPRGNDYSSLERGSYFEEDDSEIVAPIRALCRKGPSSEEEVDRVIARAQAKVLTDYRKAIAVIEDLLRLDAAISVEDRQLTYPDGARVFDEKKFPSYWRIGRMRQSITAAMAAE